MNLYGRKARRRRTRRHLRLIWRGKADRIRRSWVRRERNHIQCARWLKGIMASIWRMRMPQLLRVADEASAVQWSGFADLVARTPHLPLLTREAAADLYVSDFGGLTRKADPRRRRRLPPPIGN